MTPLPTLVIKKPTFTHWGKIEVARALDLRTILNHPEGDRNAEWERTLFQALPDSLLKVESSDPQPGPDGWPYLFVSGDTNATEPASRILQWLSTKGIGLVLSPHKQVPDYVFTYGMIWNYRERGQFLSTMQQEVVTGKIQFNPGEKVLAGPPTEEYLPGYVRQVMREFLKAQGIKDPKILVMSRDQKVFDLCFSLEALGNPPQREHQGIAEAVSWFLPAHYSVMMTSEQGLPSFHSL